MPCFWNGQYLYSLVSTEVWEGSRANSLLVIRKKRLWQRIQSRKIWGIRGSLQGHLCSDSKANTQGCCSHLLLCILGWHSVDKALSSCTETTACQTFDTTSTSLTFLLSLGSTAETPFWCMKQNLKKQLITAALASILHTGSGIVLGYIIKGDRMISKDSQHWR